MLYCDKNHNHEYYVWTRGMDDLPMDRRILRSWESAKKYIEQLGCDCCARAPAIETLEQGKLYEAGYCGSFRFVGCCRNEQYTKWWNAFEDVTQVDF